MKKIIQTLLLLIISTILSLDNSPNETTTRDSIVIVTLNPHSVKIRRKEAQNITNYIAQKNMTTQTIVMGDINNHSPSDADYLQQQALALPYFNEYRWR